MCVEKKEREEKNNKSFLFQSPLSGKVGCFLLKSLQQLIYYCSCTVHWSRDLLATIQTKTRWAKRNI